MKTKAHILFAIMAATASLLFSGCSYVMDAIEGAINERAAFSISASYDGFSNVTVRWDEKGDSGTFAGFEVYRTSRADDEYADYELVASYYYPAYLEIGLSDSSYTYDVTGLHGIYFYRIGIIAWDEDKESDRVDNYTGGSSWNVEPNRETNYNSHTEIDKISGYAQVEIP
jgi:hypothetical protein